LQQNRNDTTTLNSYGKALADNREAEKAFEFFERSLKVNPNDTTTLNSYATALANHNQPDKALALLERSLKIKPDDFVSLFLYVIILEKEGRYKPAILNLEKINPDKLWPSLVFLYSNLGQLYYLIRQESKGDEYFQLAKEKEDKPIDLSHLNAAKQIFYVNPYSEAAVELLRKISPNFNFIQVSRLLSLNLDMENYFNEFNEMITSELSI